MDYFFVIYSLALVGLVASLFYHFRPHRMKAHARRWLRMSGSELRTLNRPISFGRFYLLLFRSIVFVYITFVLVLLVKHEKFEELKFFTVWNYVTIWVIFGLGTFISCTREAEDGNITHIEKLYVILFEMELPTCLLVTLVYWTILLPDEDTSLFTTWTWFDNISEHALNVVFMLIEFGSNRIILSAERWPPTVSWMCIYCQFALVYDRIVNNGTYIYPFLDTETPHSVPWFFAIAIALLMMHYSLCILSSLKEKFVFVASAEEINTATGMQYDTLGDI